MSSYFHNADFLHTRCLKFMVMNSKMTILTSIFTKYMYTVSQKVKKQVYIPTGG